MKTITVTVTDSYFNTFMEFFKYNPNVKFDEKELNNWQKSIVLDRTTNAKPEDYRNWEDVKKDLDQKWNFNG